MRHTSGLPGKGMRIGRHPWPLLFATGLLLSLLAVFFLPCSISPVSALAPFQSSAPRAVTFSPSQGPVGAVIAVTGSGMVEADGTQVDLGYTTDFTNCVAVAGEQPGVIKNHAFSGWFRWPTTTGVGSFGVCIAVNGTRPSWVGSYQVLSATPPQVTVAPTTLNAGKQAKVTGANFLPAGTSVNLIWQTANGGSKLSLGSVTSDATGAFTQTFTVPSRSGTGSYSLVAASGSGQPPTLSASTTFHVNGITIVAVPTPVTHPSPTAAPTATPTVPATATSTASQVGTGQQATTGGGTPPPGKAAPILPIAAGGLLLIVAALIGGVFVVRRQRSLVAIATASKGQPWPFSPPPGGGGMPEPGAAYRTGGLPPPGNPNLDGPTMVYGSPGASQNQSAIPFDPTLAEAMRQAQVSLFATPRPPVGEEAPLS